jgi:hypothetical protein
VERDGGATSAVVAKLFVGPTLADLNEPEPLEDPNDLLGLKDREAAHRSGHGDVLDADELGLEDRVPVLQEHGENLPQIVCQLVQGLTLGMRTWEPGDESHIGPSLGAALDDGRVDAHQCLLRLLA